MATRNLTVASSLSLAPKSNREEAASPGNQSRKRVSGSSPPAIHSRESPVPLAQAQSFRPSQELSRFAGLTLRHFRARRNTKNGRHCEEAVDEETCLWKPEENPGAIFNGSDLFQIVSITYTSFKSNSEMDRRCGKKVEISSPRCLAISADFPSSFPISSDANRTTPQA